MKLIITVITFVLTLTVVYWLDNHKSQNTAQQTLDGNIQALVMENLLAQKAGDYLITATKTPVLKTSMVVLPSHTPTPTPRIITPSPTPHPTQTIIPPTSNPTSGQVPTPTPTPQLHPYSYPHSH